MNIDASENTTVHYQELKLSGAQLSVWRDLQLHPQDVAYSLWDCIRIGGSPDVERLRAAIKFVCESNPSFRLRFSGHNFDLRQEIVSSIEVGSIEADVPLLDFSSSADPESAAQAWMQADHAVPFEVRSPPLFRNALLRVSSDTILWYRNYHHLVADGFSMVILAQWIARAYRELKRNEQSLPKVACESYLHYVQAEAEYRRSPQFEIDRSFWTSLYSDLPPSVSLSKRQPRYTSSRQTVISEAWLPHELLEQCYSLAKTLGINVGQLLIGAVALYVHRATGEREFSLCMPTHGRERGPTLQMAGMCTNTLPLRFRFDPESSIAESLHSAGDIITRCLQHRRYRYEDLRNDLNLNSADISPFRLHANVLRTGEQLLFEDTPVQVRQFSTGPIDDLSIMVVENLANRGHFRLVAIFNPQLYEPWEIESHKHYLQRTLEAIVRDPNSRIRDVSLTNAADRERLLREFAFGPKSWRDDHCFHELFEAQVWCTPSAIAVTHGKLDLTYRELDRCANQLAHYLVGLGVRAGDIVGLCFDRSLDMITGMLGIMKAGAAYLPLAPDLPEARLTFMTEDAQVKVIVTESAHELRLPDHLAHLVFVDTLWSEFTRQPSTAPFVSIPSTGLAYVIYTSGSTGKPKGVLLQHDGLCNLAVTQAEMFGVAPGVRVLQFARFSFDASVSEIAMTLISGGTLVLADQHELLPGNLGKTLANNGIEVVTLPPSILPSLESDHFPRLKTLVVAGESCPLDVARTWSQRCRFINAYGPTETTVCATAGIYEGGDVVSIGRPIANTSTYILDDSQQPVPVGLVGELYIGGVGVGRGYLNRKELTATRYISDPFSNAANSGKSRARLYRTGDLARYLPDGTIEFLGRRDQQIKIRGFRIELGEIEAALTSNHSVSECAVIVREVTTRKQLIAYVVRRDGDSNLDSRTLRASVRAKLPDYMVPAVILFVPALPRTASGKLDRKALPPPDTAAFERPLVQPKTDTERILIEIWGEALSEKHISATDNFFDVGGDSLAALNVIALVWHRLKVELPAQDIHESVSLEELAQRIDLLRACA